MVCQDGSKMVPGLVWHRFDDIMRRRRRLRRRLRGGCERGGEMNLYGKLRLLPPDDAPRNLFSVKSIYGNVQPLAFLKDLDARDALAFT